MQPDALAPDALAPPTTTSHVLFLDFEGETITMGAADDPATNTSKTAKMSGTLAAYKQGAANRATIIAGITSEVTALVAPFDIQVVSTRPASGVYDLVVITDNNGTPIGLPSNASAASPTFCGSTHPAADVSFVFASEGGPGTSNFSAHEIAKIGLAMFASDHGVPESSVALDCMCFASATCRPLTTAGCTIGGSGTPVDTVNFPCSTGTMDERARFLQVFGPHS